MEKTVELKSAELYTNPKSYFAKKRKLQRIKMAALKKDQAELGDVYKENGAWFFRDGTELSFREAFGAEETFAVAQ